MGLTALDLGFIALALISGLLAMYRGVTRELLSILSWIVAGAATFYFIRFHRDIAADLASQVGQRVEIVQIALGAILFVLVLIVVHLITSRMSEAVLDSRVGMIDRLLGLVFGVARGALLLIFLFLLAKQIVPPEAMPGWVQDAMTYEFLNESADKFANMFRDLVPDDLQSPFGGGDDQS